MTRKKFADSTSTHEISVDEIGFIYRNMEFHHDADGVSLVTLHGESLVSGKMASLTFDARTVPLKHYEKLRDGDFITYSSYTEGNA